MKMKTPSEEVRMGDVWTSNAHHKRAEEIHRHLVISVDMDRAIVDCFTSTGTRKKYNAAFSNYPVTRDEFCLKEFVKTHNFMVENIPLVTTVMTNWLKQVENIPSIVNTVAVYYE